MKSVFRPEFLDSLKVQSENFDGAITVPNETMTLQQAIGAYDRIHNFDHRDYPETVRENKQILEDYLTLLETHGIFPIIFLPPMMKEYQEYFSRETVRELLAFLQELYQRHQFMFLNCWLIDGFVDYDFFDIDHLNISGAKKLSSILNDLVMKLERKS